MIEKVLREYHDYQGQYANRLTNHLPMVALALNDLGVDELNIKRFAQNYIRDKKICKLKKSSITIDQSNWLNYLGQHLYELEYRLFFKSEYERLKKEKFIDHYLNILIKGMAASALHGIIRLSYAIRSKNDCEIINGFAYLAISYLEVPAFENLPIKSAFAQFEVLANDDHFKNKTFKGKNITERIVEATLDPLAGQLLTAIKVSNETSHQIKAVAIDLLVKSLNFTVLHMVTGTHAFFTLLPLCKEQEQLTKTFWIVFQLAYLSTNCVELVDPKLEDTIFNRKQLIADLSISDNAHLIKIVHSALSEYQIVNNKQYLDVINALVKEGFR